MKDLFTGTCRTLTENEKALVIPFFRINGNPIKIDMVKGIYFVIYGIISEFTDKGQSVSHKLKGASRGDLPVYNTISFTKIKINFLSENI